MELSSQVLPMPASNSPEITVTSSAVGCQWGMTLYPSGIFRRTVKRPAFIGLPLTTAMRAPAWNMGGASFHFNWSGVTIMGELMLGMCPLFADFVFAVPLPAVWANATPEI